MHQPCRECGSTYVAERPHAVFCSTLCRNAFNNRRMQRGAVLYDLFMAVRYQRGPAKALGLWTTVCALAQGFREEDKTRRPGFVSWLDPADVLSRNCALRAIRSKV